MQEALDDLHVWPFEQDVLHAPRVGDFARSLRVAASVMVSLSDMVKMKITVNEDSATCMMCGWNMPGFKQQLMF